MLKEILSISGQSGLFKLVSKGKNTIIVESLADGKRMPVNGSSRISALDEISMYTDGDDVKLRKVMAMAFRFFNGGAGIDAKKASVDELKKAMDGVMPNWDKDRVYNSDLKKLFSWYNILLNKGIINEKAVAEVENEKEEE
ncbi:MAG: DUF5606 domain-containing protein [Bacteroidales bacterium]|nr:DUF5606 domain-containing protein [Bacteroidales bacterium]